MPLLEQTDLAQIFADFAAGTHFDDLPGEVVEVTKTSILDTLGVIVGASGVTPGVKELVELVKEAGGKEESSILAFGGKVPAWMAAFVNGSMAHGLDYDDVLDAAGLHASSSTVPGAFALAERLGNVNGRDFVTAVAIGNEIAYRLGLAVSLKHGWHTTAVLGVFASAAACGKLLKLTAPRMVHALGIAFCQAACTVELGLGVGSDLRGMYPAFPGKTGVLSALMASKGIAGVKSSFEGRAGLFAVYFKGEYDRDVLVADLGKRFQVVNTSFKTWPACRVTHPFIEATLKLMSDHAISADDIEEIVTYDGTVAHNCALPLETRRRPQSTLDAKFSIPFVVAIAATKGSVEIDDLSPDGIHGEAFLAMAQRVKPVLCSDFDSFKGLTPGRVEIRTKQGKTHSKTVEYAYGHPRNPIAKGELISKFEACAAHAVRPIPKQAVGKVIELVDRLEHLDDVAPVAQLLS